MFTEDNYVPNPIDLAPRKTLQSEGMDGQVLEWMNKLDLNNYKWFYMSLSYNEMSLINKFNIDMFINRARFIKGFHSNACRKIMTKAAKKRVISTSLVLKERPKKLKELLEVIIYYYLIKLLSYKYVFFIIVRLEFIETF